MGGDNPRVLRLVDIAQNGLPGAIAPSAAPLVISVEGRIVASIMMPATGYGGWTR